MNSNNIISLEKMRYAKLLETFYYVLLNDGLPDIAIVFKTKEGMKFPENYIGEFSGIERCAVLNIGPDTHRPVYFTSTSCIVKINEYHQQWEVEIPNENILLMESEHRTMILTQEMREYMHNA